MLTERPPASVPARHFPVATPAANPTARAMADRGKRKRAEPSHLSEEHEPESPIKFKLATPSAKYLTRTGRLRLPGDERWLSCKLLSYIGADKLTCEVELLDGGASSGAAVTEAGGGRRMKVKLSTQPLHAAEDVVWAAEEGDGPTNAALLRAHGESGSGGRSATDVDVRLQAGFVEGLVPMLVFAPLGLPEAEAEDGHVLALNLESGKHVWIRPEASRSLLAQMLRRRTSTALRKAADAALEAEKAIKLVEMRNKKKLVVGRRLAVYWPDDDAWYHGTVSSWDPQTGQHHVFYDDGIEEAIYLHEEASHFFASEAEEVAYVEYSMMGSCLHCKKRGWLLKDVVCPPVAEAPADESSAAGKVLPLGWREELHVAPSRTYSVYHGPTGEKARSIAEANRIHDAAGEPAVKRPKPPPPPLPPGFALKPAAVEVSVVVGSGELPVPASPADAPMTALLPTPGAAESIFCSVCHGGDAELGNDILICDGLGCGKTFHQRCHKPSVLEVPENEWLCAECVRSGNQVDPAALAEMAAQQQVLAKQRGLAAEAEEHYASWLPKPGSMRAAIIEALREGITERDEICEFVTRQPEHASQHRRAILDSCGKEKGREVPLFDQDETRYKLTREGRLALGRSEPSDLSEWQQSQGSLAAPARVGGFDGAGGDMLMCGSCLDRCHLQCHWTALESRRDLWPSWKCLGCKQCESCGEDGTKVRLAICDVCDRGYHIGCLDPPLKSFPQRHFKCPQCVRCSSCGTTTSKVWGKDYDMCGPCEKQFKIGQYCPICQRAHRAEETEMLQCDR